MKFSQERVARLLGHWDSSTLCKYESGQLLPGLTAALQLGIILRIPIEFLFPELYNELQRRIRTQEENPDEVKRNAHRSHARPHT
jgi:transcriptional regulator with XRE-family HTH domain